MGLMVIVVGLLADPAATVNDEGLGDRLKFTNVAAHAVANLSTSGDPHPVT
jgi:hypothetical protein